MMVVVYLVGGVEWETVYLAINNWVAGIVMYVSVSVTGIGCYIQERYLGLLESNNSLR